MEGTDGKLLKQATPSMPVVITGLKQLPEFGDSFQVVSGEKEARNIVSQVQAGKSSSGGHLQISSNELIRLINRSNQLQEFNVIIKADVQGSLTSVVDSLKTLDNEEVAVRIVGSGVGAITENDIHMAGTSNAVIYGFQATLPTSIKQLASPVCSPEQHCRAPASAPLSDAEPIRRTDRPTSICRRAAFPMTTRGSAT